MHRYESAFAQLMAETAQAELEAIRPLIKSPESGRGDACLPCFTLAKQMKKSPAVIAQDLAARAPASPLFCRIEAVGPYVNAFVDPRHLVSTIVPEIRSLDERFGRSELGAGQTVVVDYSSPNIAKPLGFHHLRSTMIGNALARIHCGLGYQVMGINFLGDWGKTFGLLAESFERFGDVSKLEHGGIAYLLELYVKANQAAKEEPGFDEAARAMFRRQEEGEPRALELWQRFRQTSLDEFYRLYGRLGVAFDAIEGESHYRHGMDAVISRIASTAGTREDQGALVVDMEYGPNEPPLLLRKSDGATLYATRDIAAAIDRWERFQFAKSLYVVGNEQRQHFDQLKRTLQAMGCSWSERVVHVQFGRVQGMSTRKGTVVFLEEVLDEARDRALARMRETSAEEREVDIETAAEQVGVGGVVFGDLKNLRSSDYTFDWEDVLNPKGFTGICCQYAHARCCSMLRKSASGVPALPSFEPALLTAEEEIGLVKELARLPGAIEAAGEELEPSKLARAVYEIARAWNRYQQAGMADRGLRVLCEDENLSKARLALVDATRIGLRNGLDLLGVQAPQAM